MEELGSQGEFRGLIIFLSAVFDDSFRKGFSFNFCLINCPFPAWATDVFMMGYKIGHWGVSLHDNDSLSSFNFLRKG